MTLPRKKKGHVKGRPPPTLGPRKVHHVDGTYAPSTAKRKLSPAAIRYLERKLSQLQ